MKVKSGDKVRARYDDEDKASLATVLEVITESGSPDMVRLLFLEGVHKGWQCTTLVSSIAIIRKEY